MSKEVNRAIALAAAKHLVQLYGSNVENISVYEYVADQLPGLDSDMADEIEALIFGFMEVASIHVSIPEFQVNDDGSLKTKDQVDKELADQVVAW